VAAKAARPGCRCRIGLLDLVRNQHERGAHQSVSFEHADMPLVPAAHHPLQTSYHSDAQVTKLKIIDFLGLWFIWTIVTICGLAVTYCPQCIQDAVIRAAMAVLHACMSWWRKGCHDDNMDNEGAMDKEEETERPPPINPDNEGAMLRELIRQVSQINHRVGAEHRLLRQGSKGRGPASKLSRLQAQQSQKSIARERSTGSESVQDVASLSASAPSTSTNGQPARRKIVTRHAIDSPKAAALGVRLVNRVKKSKHREKMPNAPGSKSSTVQGVDVQGVDELEEGRG